MMNYIFETKIILSFLWTPTKFSRAAFKPNVPCNSSGFLYQNDSCPCWFSQHTASMDTVHSLPALHQLFFIYLSLLITALKASLGFNHICTPCRVYPESFSEDIQFVELTATVVFLFFQTKVFHCSLSLKLSYKENLWSKSYNTVSLYNYTNIKECKCQTWNKVTLTCKWF